MTDWKRYQMLGDAVLEYTRALRVIEQAEREAAKAAQVLIERFGYDPAKAVVVQETDGG